LSSPSANGHPITKNLIKFSIARPLAAGLPIKHRGQGLPCGLVSFIPLNFGGVQILNVQNMNTLLSQCQQKKYSQINLLTTSIDGNPSISSSFLAAASLLLGEAHEAA
jgi:hypothetical protein